MPAVEHYTPPHMPPDHVSSDDPTIPPPGSRSGHGSDSVLPFLARTLAGKPQVKPGDFADTIPEPRAGEKPESKGE